MRKILTAAAAALTLAGGLTATTVPAQAQTRHSYYHGGGHYGGYHGGYRGSSWGWGVGAGLAGFALGSALASPYYYGPGYYSYDYGPGYYDYGGCARRVWDSYWGRWTVRYYC